MTELQKISQCLEERQPLCGAEEQFLVAVLLRRDLLAGHHQVAASVARLAQVRGDALAERVQVAATQAVQELRR